MKKKQERAYILKDGDAERPLEDVYNALAIQLRGCAATEPDDVLRAQQHTKAGMFEAARDEIIYQRGAGSGADKRVESTQGEGGKKTAITNRKKKQKRVEYLVAEIDRMWATGEYPTKLEIYELLADRAFLQDAEFKGYTNSTVIKRLYQEANKTPPHGRGQVRARGRR